MRPSSQITRDNIGCLEPGDRIRLTREDAINSVWPGPHDFEVTVAETVLDRAFGPQIISKEAVPAGKGFDTGRFYLDDGWDIELVADVRTLGGPTPEDIAGFADDLATIELRTKATFDPSTGTITATPIAAEAMAEVILGLPWVSTRLRAGAAS